MKTKKFFLFALFFLRAALLAFPPMMEAPDADEQRLDSIDLNNNLRNDRLSDGDKATPQLTLNVSDGVAENASKSSLEGIFVFRDLLATSEDGEVEDQNLKQAIVDARNAADNREIKKNVDLAARETDEAKASRNINEANEAKREWKRRESDFSSRLLTQPCSTTLQLIDAVQACWMAAAKEEEIERIWNARRDKILANDQSKFSFDYTNSKKEAGAVQREVFELAQLSPIEKTIEVHFKKADTAWKEADVRLVAYNKAHSEVILTAAAAGKAAKIEAERKADADAWRERWKNPAQSVAAGLRTVGDSRINAVVGFFEGSVRGAQAAYDMAKRFSVEVKEKAERAARTKKENAFNGAYAAQADAKKLEHDAWISNRTQVSLIAQQEARTTGWIPWANRTLESNQYAKMIEAREQDKVLTHYQKVQSARVAAAAAQQEAEEAEEKLSETHCIKIEKENCMRILLAQENENFNITSLFQAKEQVVAADKAWKAADANYALAFAEAAALQQEVNNIERTLEGTAHAAQIVIARTKEIAAANWIAWNAAWPGLLPKLELTVKMMHRALSQATADVINAQKEVDKISKESEEIQRYAVMACNVEAWFTAEADKSDEASREALKMGPSNWLYRFFISDTKRQWAKALYDSAVVNDLINRKVVNRGGADQDFEFEDYEMVYSNPLQVTAGTLADQLKSAEANFANQYRLNNESSQGKISPAEQTIEDAANKILLCHMTKNWSVKWSREMQESARSRADQRPWVNCRESQPWGSECYWHWEESWSGLGLRTTEFHPDDDIFSSIKNAALTIQKRKNAIHDTAADLVEKEKTARRNLEEKNKKAQLLEERWNSACGLLNEYKQKIASVIPDVFNIMEVETYIANITSQTQVNALPKAEQERLRGRSNFQNRNIELQRREAEVKQAMDDLNKEILRMESVKTSKPRLIEKAQNIVEVVHYLKYCSDIESFSNRRARYLEAFGHHNCRDDEQFWSRLAAHAKKGGDNGKEQLDIKVARLKRAQELAKKARKEFAEAEKAVTKSENAVNTAIHEGASAHFDLIIAIMNQLIARSTVIMSDINESSHEHSQLDSDLKKLFLQQICDAKNETLNIFSKTIAAIHKTKSGLLEIKKNFENQAEKYSKEAGQNLSESSAAQFKLKQSSFLSYWFNAVLTANIKWTSEIAAAAERVAARSRAASALVKNEFESFEIQADAASNLAEVKTRPIERIHFVTGDHKVAIIDGTTLDGITTIADCMTSLRNSMRLAQNAQRNFKTIVMEQAVQVEGERLSKATIKCAAAEEILSNTESWISRQLFVTKEEIKKTQQTVSDAREEKNKVDQDVREKEQLAKNTTAASVDKAGLNRNDKKVDELNSAVREEYEQGK